MDSRFTKRREIGTRIYYEYKAKRDGGKMTEATFKKSYPKGGIAARGTAAYKEIDTEYRAWLKANGHPMPAAPKTKAAPKKKAAAPKTKAAPKKKAGTKKKTAAPKTKAAPKKTAAPKTKAAPKKKAGTKKKTAAPKKKRVKISK